MNLVVFAGLLAVACAAVVTGVALWSVPAAFVVGGVLLAGWATLFVWDVPSRGEGVQR